MAGEIMRGGSQHARGLARARRGTFFLLLLLTVAACPSVRAAQTIRAVAYNIEADVNGDTAPNSGLTSVLEAIGEGYFIQGSVNIPAHPIDLLALEETTSNTLTVAPIVTALNGYYGAGTYAMSPVQGLENGNNPSTGNGPNAMIYNTTTLTLLASVGVGTASGSSNGEYRQVMRYEFMPVGGATGTQFYVYVCHMKAGTTPTDANDRAKEAVIVNADIGSLPANGGVLCMGDFNLDSSSEKAYTTLTGTGGQLVDPYSASWTSAKELPLFSESVTALDYRDDIQFMSPAVYNGTSTVGLHYIPSTYSIFANNGTVAQGKSINQSGNTALNGLQGSVTASAALTALSTASDHLPNVANYIVVSTPYGAWQAKYFNSTQLNDPTVSGNAADPDGDGIPNLLEYALNLSPTTPGVAGLPTVGQTVVSGSTYLTLTFTKVIAATDITYVPQVSGDLVTWNAGASYVGAVNTTNNADNLTQTIVVRDLTAVSGAQRRFIRLTVTMP